MTLLNDEFVINAIPELVMQEVRSTGLDVSGQPVVRLVAQSDEPLRCCLRNARAGEPCLLFGYEPPLPAASPYREIGAVYAHTEPCEGWAGGYAYPPEWLGRPQALRAYDNRGWIHPSTTVHDGTDLSGAIADLLADPEVVEVHVRNLAYGCFMFSAATAPDRLSTPPGVTLRSGT
jgi:hypothetical protein